MKTLICITCVLFTLPLSAQMCPGVVKVKAVSQNLVRIDNTNGDRIQITVPQTCTIMIGNTAGQTIQSITLKSGINTISTEKFSAGIYFLRCAELNLVKRFYVSK